MRSEGSPPSRMSTLRGKRPSDFFSTSTAKCHTAMWNFHVGCSGALNLIPLSVSRLYLDAKPRKIHYALPGPAAPERGELWTFAQASE